MTRRTHAAVVLALTLATFACSGASSENEPLVVFAASSLTDVLSDVRPTARYSFAGSDELATQIREGAPADVFASASPKLTRALFAEGLVETPRTFAANELVMAVSADDESIAGIEDLTRPDVKVVVAAPGVPAGDYTIEALESLGRTDILDRVVSREQDVKGVIGKVALGEADAGFVYATDIGAGPDIRAISLPPQAQPGIHYSVAVVSDTDDRGSAEAFVRSLLGSEGRAALLRAGFDVP